MAFKSAVTGLGATVEFCTTSGGAYTSVGTQLKTVEGTNFETVMIALSGIGGDGWEEQIPAIKKAGEFGFSVNYDPNDTAISTLIGHWASKTILYWKLKLPAPIGPGAGAGTAKMFTFAGYIKGCPTTGYDQEAALEGSFSVATTGPVVGPSAIA